MSLRHALLAILTAEPMTGYDLVKYFDGTVAFVWSAPHSQIYPELRKMEAIGLVEATELPRGDRAKKRLYAITGAGISELRRWALETHPPPPERNLHRLKAVYFEWGSYEAARRQLQTHRNHYLEQLSQWQFMVDSIDSNQVPLLTRRLESRPAEEHDAIVSVKRFAFEGELARAQAEVSWAENGLQLLDELEQAGVPLTGQSFPLV